MKSKMKPILDRQLSQLDWTPEETQQMLRQMRGEIPVKKKLSLALVLAIALAMMAATALAVTLWKNYHEQIAHNEGTIGYFDTWTGQQRADFVLAMQQEGITFDAQQLKLLSDTSTTDQQKKEIATRLITEKYGIREDVVTAISILEAEFGPLPNWDMERKAAYTQLLEKTGTLGKDEEMYWMPGKGDISQQQAIETARKAIVDKFDVKEAELDKMRLVVELRSYAHEREARTWHVGFFLPDADAYDPEQYSVWLDAATGSVQSCEDIARQVAEAAAKAPPPDAQNLLQELIDEFFARQPFALEELVDLQAVWRPRVEKMKIYNLDDGGMVRVFINLTEMGLRVPAEGDLPLEDARAKAREAALALPGWTEEKLSALEPYAEVLYHSKDWGKDVYQFFFSRRPRPDPGTTTDESAWDAHEQEYLKPLYAMFGGENTKTPLYVSVRLDAGTGELIEAPQVVFPSTDARHEFTLMK